MADAAARREARRKRILENSENRLQRITGINVGVKEDKSTSSFSPLNPDPVNVEDEIVPDTNANPEPRKPQGEIFDEKQYLEVRDSLTDASSLSSNDLRKRKTDVHEANNDARFSLDEKKQNTVNKATDESERDVNTRDPVQRDFSQASFLYGVFSSKWILVILAAFVNVLYILQIQHLCGKTILAPFLTLMLMRLHLADSKSEAQSGSMLSAALILCNIKPELVHNLRWVMKTVKKIIGELSIYIFSFVIFYNIACSYWNDIDINLSTIDSEDNGKLQ